MDQSQNRPTWDEVPKEHIARELARYRRQYPKRDSVWMVTCRYGDGEPTCQVCIEFPCSDLSRKQFTLRWGT